MTGNIDVSIILGLYNAERYVRRCLDSLVNQTLRNIEIIIVDDGSKDASIDIARDFAAGDRRIRILSHDSNRGRSAALNTGLAAATGRCIRFVDNDDYLPLDATEILFGVHRRLNSQIVRGRLKVVRNGAIIELKRYQRTREAFNVRFSDHEGLSSYYGADPMYLFERRFLENHGFRWREDIIVGEDLIWNSGCLTAADTISAIDDCVYYYCDNSIDSLMRPAAPRPDHYLTEAAAHAITAKTLGAHPLAFFLFYVGLLPFRRRRLREAADAFAEDTVLPMLAEYARIYQTIPPATAFAFLEARRPNRQLPTGGLRFASLLASGRLRDAYLSLRPPA